MKIALLFVAMMALNLVLNFFRTRSTGRRRDDLRYYIGMSFGAWFGIGIGSGESVLDSVPGTVLVLVTACVGVTIGRWTNRTAPAAFGLDLERSVR